MLIAKAPLTSNDRRRTVGHCYGVISLLIRSFQMHDCVASLLTMGVAEGLLIRCARAQCTIIHRTIRSFLKTTLRSDAITRSIDLPVESAADRNIVSVLDTKRNRCPNAPLEFHFPNKIDVHIEYFYR